MSPACTSSGLRFDLPHIQMIGVAGGGDLDAFLTGGPVERGADVFLAVRQGREWNLKCSPDPQPLDIAQQLGNDLFMLPVAAFRHVELANGLKPRGCALCLRTGRHDFDSYAQLVWPCRVLVLPPSVLRNPA